MHRHILTGQSVEAFASVIRLASWTQDPLLDTLTTQSISPAERLFPGCEWIQ